MDEKTIQTILESIAKENSNLLVLVPKLRLMVDAIIASHPELTESTELRATQVLTDKMIVRCSRHHHANSAF